MVNESKFQANRVRYTSLREMPKFQKWMRKYQDTHNVIFKIIYKLLFVYYRNKNCVDISADINIDGGLYIGYPYCIVINAKAIIGKNCNIHKNVKIGQENREKRKGIPIIGNNIWIGVNATIVDKIVIGDDVLIAPNSYVNFDIPSYSVVMGNPGIIIPKEDATSYYINNTMG